MTERHIDKPGEWSVNMPPEWVTANCVTIGTLIGLNVYDYYEPPRLLGAVIALEPVTITWDAAPELRIESETWHLTRVTIDCDRPWSGGLVRPGPTFWEWAVLHPPSPEVLDATIRAEHP